MLSLPLDPRTRFEVFLSTRHTPKMEWGAYVKWLRYYRDYCDKYHFPEAREESLLRFLDKLREKRRTSAQQQQAAHAIALYHELLHAMGTQATGSFPQTSTLRDRPTTRAPDRAALKPSEPYTPPAAESQAVGCMKSSYRPLPYDREVGASTRTSPVGAASKAPSESASRTMSSSVTGDVVKGCSWREELSRLSREIQHYSPKTLKTCMHWARHFRTYTGSKYPQALSSEDVKAFLTSPAVTENVSASTRNQAFNALLFFYRHVPSKEFGKLEGVVRAKQRPCIPVVLSREEIDAILTLLPTPCDLVVKLLHGCGLRLFECLRLHCLDFDAEFPTVHDGKGQKDRTVPLPRPIMPELRSRIQFLKDLHPQDLASGYAGVFPVGALDRKYKNAAKELVRQWIFPAKELAHVPEANEYRRYCLHERRVQKAIKDAVDNAGICKRAGAHSFRHSFAGHLPQANHDIRTIQELPGHSDVNTTMIHTRTVKSNTIKEARSPLDLLPECGNGSYWKPMVGAGSELSSPVIRPGCPNLSPSAPGIHAWAWRELGSCLHHFGQNKSSDAIDIRGQARRTRGENAGARQESTS